MLELLLELVLLLLRPLSLLLHLLTVTPSASLSFLLALILLLLLLVLCRVSSTSSEASAKESEVVRDAEQGFSHENEPLLGKSTKKLEAQKISSSEVFEQGGRDILFFSAHAFHADESDQSVKITVLRYGTGEGVVSAKYSTVDNTAVNSKDYVCESGEIVLAAGEFSKTFEIDLLHNDDWSQTKVCLVQMASPRNCMLDDHHKSARIYIINEDGFPNDDFASLDPDSSFSPLRSVTLYFGFCKFMLHQKGMLGITLVSIVLDQLKAIVLFGNLWVGMYTVDTLFARDPVSSENPDRYHIVILVASWFVVPNIVLHCSDAFREHLGVAGQIRNFLQLSVIRKYLELKTTCVSKVTHSELSGFLAGDSSAAAESYVAGMNLITVVGKIGAIVLFLLLYQPQFSALCFMLLILLLLLSINGLRMYSVAHAVADLSECETDVDATATEAIKNWQLLKDFARQILFASMFEKVVLKKDKAMTSYSVIRNNTRYTTVHVLGFVIFLYFVTSAPAVINRDLSLGIFLTTIGIFTTYLADAIADLNAQGATIVDSLVPLAGITYMLNMPTMFSDAKDLEAARSENSVDTFQIGKTVSLAKAGLSPRPISEGTASSCPISDSTEIQLCNVSFKYAGSLEGKEPTHILRDVNLPIPRGQVTSIIGVHRSGKGTLLQLLSDDVVPTSGGIFVPLYLRVLHVRRNPLFIRGSMLFNLLLGLPEGFKMKMSRVLDILTVLDLQEVIPTITQECKELTQTDCLEDAVLTRDNLKREMLAHILESKRADANWIQTTNNSLKQKLNLARAFIADPDVMILDNTMQVFNEDVGVKVMGVLRQFAAQGCTVDPDNSRVPHMKTVIFTTTRPQLALQADMIAEMDPKNHTINVVNHEIFRRKYLSSET